MNILHPIRTLLSKTLGIGARRFVNPVVVRNVSEEIMGHAGGLAYPDLGVALIRKGLSRGAAKYIEAHELFHLQDLATWGGTFGSEMRATIIPAFRHPIGFTKRFVQKVFAKDKRIPTYKWLTPNFWKNEYSVVSRTGEQIEASYQFARRHAPELTLGETVSKTDKENLVRLMSLPKRGKGFGESLDVAKLMASEGLHPQAGPKSPIKRMIKKNTPFGSRYDLLKHFAMMLGESYEELLKQPGRLRNILKNAVVESRVGKGRFGEVDIMSLALPNRKTPFRFIRKHVFTEAELRAAEAEAIRRGKPLGDPATYIPPEEELKVLSKVRKSSMTPTPYYVEGQDLFMELMPGKAVSLMSATEKQGFKAFLGGSTKRIGRQLKGLFSRISPTDIQHGGNIMYDPATKRLSIVDLSPKFTYMRRPLMEEQNWFVNRLFELGNYKYNEIKSLMPQYVTRPLHLSERWFRTPVTDDIYNRAESNAVREIMRETTRYGKWPKQLILPPDQLADPVFEKLVKGMGRRFNVPTSTVTQATEQVSGLDDITSQSKINDLRNSNDILGIDPNASTPKLADSSSPYQGPIITLPTAEAMVRNRRLGLHGENVAASPYLASIKLNMRGNTSGTINTPFNSPYEGMEKDEYIAALMARGVKLPNINEYLGVNVGATTVVRPEREIIEDWLSGAGKGGGRHFSEYTEQIMATGTALHRYEQARLARENRLRYAEKKLVWGDTGIRGYLDIVTNEGIIQEIKSIEQGRLQQRQSAYPMHIAQMQLYLAATGQESGLLTYVSREDLSFRKTYQIDYDQSIVDEQLSKLARARAAVIDAIDNNIIDVEDLRKSEINLEDKNVESWSTAPEYVPPESLDYESASEEYYEELRQLKQMKRPVPKNLDKILEERMAERLDQSQYSGAEEHYKRLGLSEATALDSMDQVSSLTGEIDTMVPVSSDLHGTEAHEDRLYNSMNNAARQSHRKSVDEDNRDAAVRQLEAWRVEILNKQKQERDRENINERINMMMLQRANEGGHVNIGMASGHGRM